jgi:outer membrane protein assembly factor BamA
MWAALVVLLMAGSEGRALQHAAETVAAIQIQGNTVTPDEEMRRLAGVQLGMPFDATTLDAVAARLKAAKHFDRVEVRKRFASIDDPSQITLVIVVDEGPVKIVMTGDPDRPTKVVRKRLPTLMPYPILSREDGFGFTYGARLTLAEPRRLGKNSRLTFPVSWGGTRQAGVTLEKRFPGAPIDRVTATASVSRRHNQAFDQDDDRARLSVRGEREFTRAFRVGGGGGWQRASFEGVADEFAQVGGDVVFDTRADPILARNAVYARAEWEHLQFGNGQLTTPLTPSGYAGYQGSANRTELDGRGYLGVVGQTVLAARIFRLDSDRPLPPYLQPQLGGLSTLRGFRVGSFVGDTLVTMSAEVVQPLTSPVTFFKLGVTAFFRLNVAVAHGRGATTRVHVGGNVTF